MFGCCDMVLMDGWWMVGCYDMVLMQSCLSAALLRPMLMANPHPNPRPMWTARASSSTKMANKYRINLMRIFRWKRAWFVPTLTLTQPTTTDTVVILDLIRLLARHLSLAVSCLFLPYPNPNPLTGCQYRNEFATEAEP